MAHIDEDEIIYANNMWPHICDQGFPAINILKDGKLLAHAHFSIETAKTFHARFGDVIEEAESKQHGKPQ